MDSPPAGCGSGSWVGAGGGGGVAMVFTVAGGGGGDGETVRAGEADGEQEGVDAIAKAVPAAMRPALRSRG